MPGRCSDRLIGPGQPIPIRPRASVRRRREGAHKGGEVALIIRQPNPGPETTHENACSSSDHAPAARAPGIGGRDSRQPVTMPAMMQEHMRANMRDHLLALGEIQAALAGAQYDAAAEIAERRLGMASLDAHGARHVAGFMPEGMQAIGTGMPHAASRFAVTAQAAAVTGDLARAPGGLAEVTQQCVACHAGYRLVTSP